MIWQRRQLIVWWLVSAAAVAGITAWLVLNWHVRTQHGNITHGASLKHAHEWLDENLSLTKEQHEKLETLATAAERELAAQRILVLAAEKEVMETLGSGDEGSTGVEAALEAALQKVSDKRDALQRTVIKHFRAVCNVLDAAQRKAFLDWNSSQFDSP